MDNEDTDDLDLGAAIQSARANQEDDEPKVDVVHRGGLEAKAVEYGEANDLPYVKLLKAAVALVKTGELSMEEYVEGVGKLDAIADNALKLYAIPAVKKDLPGKLTEHQNAIVGGLEAQIHKMKEGLGILLSYPETEAVGDLEVGLQMAVSAMNEIDRIQSAADAERDRIQDEEQEEKARRAQKAAQAEAEM
ncbi:MAG: hypothetical protein KC800_18025 [Candidatus Eremiobacteraeota bacterium]|nr:hypothetical protein [Candidatus Eremiobacteraeota bacterium]